MAVFLSGAVNSPSVGTGRFSDYDWATIIKVCQMNAVPDTWEVGSQKALSIGGVEYLVDIIGKNHDTYSDGTGKAPLTFQLHDCYGEKDYITGTSANTGGWKNCNIRINRVPVYFAAMPSEVQAGIREVNKLTSAGGKSATINTTADKLFLLSEIEIFGALSYSYAGEGNQYEYYSKGNTKVKRVVNTASTWWTRSPNKNNTETFCATHTDGLVTNSSANSIIGISFAFCF